MRRVDLLRHREHHECGVHREGANHSIYRNPATGRTTAVPRHREIAPVLARMMCQQLAIPRPL